jgi:succinate dehydrogenase / fumarate reductase iron-sulfur subunit
MSATNAMKTVEFSIYRYNPEIDEKPRMQSYTLDIEDGHDMMLLTALKKIKEMDPTLGFRHSCGEGVCGSDGMSVNGKNVLTCVNPVSAFKQPIQIRPLPSLPVIRDLIVDMTQFYAHYEKIQPYLQNSKPAPEKERLQSPADREKLDGLYECILCACCTTSCPSFWWNPDKFLGPAALLQAFRFIVDTRDDSTEKRLEQFEDAYSLYRCHGIMNCVDVCPKDLNPTKAIAHIRQEMLKDHADKQ